MELFCEMLSGVQCHGERLRLRVGIGDERGLEDTHYCTLEIGGLG